VNGLVASPVQPASASPSLASAQAEHFHCPGGVHLSSPEPIVKAALVVLSEAWPKSLPFPKLRALARARLQGGPIQASTTVAQDTEQLGQTLWHFYAKASTLAVEFSVRPVPAGGPGERPVARALARWQAGQGPYVTNLRHELIQLTDLERHLLPRLDGTHDRAALLSVLRELVARGDLTIEQNGEVVSEPLKKEELLREALDAQLRQFARNSLLLG
jgi:methyltransferase-like protein